MRRGLRCLAVVLAGFVAGAGQPAWAQGADVPSVGVAPMDTRPDDPNGGQWFVLALAPGQTGRLRARVVNPAGVDQRVRLSFADLDFAEDGTPSVADVASDVGTWGSFDEPDVTVPARGSVVAPFSVTAPDGAEAGDHVGVVLATGAPGGDGLLKVVKRVATRLYVTIPGDARRQFSIARVDVTKDSAAFPREATVRVTLRNTGRVRLHPVVTVNGNRAAGPSLLMTKSIEPYLVTLPIPLWGGPMRYRVDATTDLGVTNQVYKSTFVMPWHLLIGLVVLVLVVQAVRLVVRRRGTRYAALREDLRRLERLLAGQAAGGGAGPRGEAKSYDPEHAIRAAMKQARRTGDSATEDKLRAKLEESRGPRADARDDSLGAVLAELRHASGDRVDALVAAARAFGLAELRAHAAAIDALPKEVRLKLLFRVGPARPSTFGRRERHPEPAPHHKPKRH